MLIVDVGQPPLERVRPSTVEELILKEVDRTAEAARGHFKSATHYLLGAGEKLLHH